MSESKANFFDTWEPEVRTPMSAGAAPVAEVPAANFFDTWQPTQTPESPLSEVVGRRLATEAGQFPPRRAEGTVPFATGQRPEAQAGVAPESHRQPDLPPAGGIISAEDIPPEESKEQQIAAGWDALRAKVARGASPSEYTPGEWRTLQLAGGNDPGLLERAGRAASVSGAPVFGPMFAPIMAEETPEARTFGEHAADYVGGLAGSLTELYGWGKVAEMIPGVQGYVAKLAAKGKVGKIGAAGTMNALTFLIAGQAGLPPGASIGDRIKTLGKSQLEAMAFTAAGTLSKWVPGKLGKALEAEALYGTGYWLARKSGASETESHINGAVLLLYHVIGNLGSGPAAERRFVESMNRLGVKPEEGRRLWDQGMRSVTERGDLEEFRRIERKRILIPDKEVIEKVNKYVQEEQAKRPPTQPPTPAATPVLPPGVKVPPGKVPPPEGTIVPKDMAAPAPPAKPGGVDYRGVHRAPQGTFGEGSLDAMNKTYPDDVYASDAPRIYGDRQSPARDRKAHRVIMQMRGKPDAEVTVYRAVPKGTQADIQPGDWVSTVREYAEKHGERFDEGATILSRKVRSGDLFTEGNSLFEFGWQPKVAPPTPPAPAAPIVPEGEIRVGSRVRLTGTPRTGEVLKVMPQTPEEAANKEQAYRVKFGKEEGVYYVTEGGGDIVPVKGGEKPARAQALAKTEVLDARLKELGMEPSVFKNRPDKLAAIKRAEAKAAGKGGFAALGGESYKPTFVEETPAGKVQKKFDWMREEITRSAEEEAGSKATKLAVALWDVNAPVRNVLKKNSLGQVAMRRLELSRGWSGEAQRQVGKTLGDIEKNLPVRYWNVLADYLNAKRTIEVGQIKEGIRSPISPEESSLWIQSLQKTDPELFARVDKAANKFWAAMADSLGQLRDAGIISPSQHNAISEKHQFYVPRRFLQHLDSMTSQTQGGKRVSVTDSGIRALDTGSENALATDPDYLLRQVVARTQARIFKNRANLALLDYVNSPAGKESGIVVEKPTGVTQSGAPTWGEPPAGYERIKVWRNGTEQHILMPTELAKGWVLSDPQLNQDFVRWAGWLSGANIVRPLATGINPEFALSNIPRDTAYAWMRTQEYSSVLPVAWSQMARDFAAVRSDVFGEKGLVDQFVKSGGSQEYLTTYGLGGAREAAVPLTEAARNIQTVKSFLGWVGNKSELWTRIALMKRALRNGKSVEEATHIARTYLDFAQGGSLTKAVDKAVPYLNAGVQGTRGLLETFRNNPKVATFKLAQLMTVASGLAYWNRQLNEQAWDSVSDREKTTNWIITTPFYWTSKSGVKRFLYLRIPKDNTQRLFSTIAEELTERFHKGRANYGRVAKAIGDFLPVDAASILPPSVAAMLTYVYNKDFWTSEDVWKGGPVTPKEEWGLDTPKGAILAGQVTQMSPERLTAASQRLVPVNPYTTLMGAMPKLVLPSDDRLSKTMTENVLAFPGIRRLARLSSARTVTERDIQEAKRLGVEIEELPPLRAKEELGLAERKQADERVRLNRMFDLHIRMIRGSPEEQRPATRQQMQNWLVSLPLAERKRLASRGAIWGGLDPETRTILKRMR